MLCYAILYYTMLLTEEREEHIFRDVARRAAHAGNAEVLPLSSNWEPDFKLGRN